MNCSRAWLRSWQGALTPMCLALSLVVPAGALRAEPLVRGKTAADFAHLTPGPKFDTPKDLELSPEGRRQADALAAFVEGFIAEDEADADTALERYQHVLELDPGYAELAAKVAAELDRRGSTADAINVLKDAAKASPKAALPRIFLAGLYQRALKKNDIAEKYGNEAIALEPENAAAWRLLLDIYLGSDQKPKAVQLVERAAKSPITTPAFWLEVAQMGARVYLNEDGSSDPANLAKYNAILKRAVALSGDDVTAITKIADFYVISRQVNEAIPLYLRALALKPDSSEPLIAATRDKLARSFRFIGNKDEAIKILRELAEKNPERFETHELLGELYEEKEDFDNALACYEKSLSLDDSQPAAFLRVADMYLKIQNRTKEQAQADKAVEILQKAHAKFPDLGAVTYSLAVALGRAKQNDTAMATFEEAAEEFSSTQPDMLNASFYLAWGAAAEQANNVEKATELLKKALELEPNSAEVLNYLGFMWIDRDMNLEEAGGMIQKALEQDPENPAYVDSLGWFYYKKGEYEKALTELLKAVAALTPEDPVVFDHVGDTYAKLGNMAQALVYWQKSLKLDPANKKVAEKAESAKQKVTSVPSSPAPLSPAHVPAPAPAPSAP